MKKALQQLEQDKGLLEKQVRRSSYKLNEELQKALEDQKNELSKEHNKKLEELQSESKQYQSMSARIQRFIFLHIFNHLKEIFAI